MIGEYMKNKILNIIKIEQTTQSRNKTIHKVFCKNILISKSITKIAKHSKKHKNR